MMTTTGTTDYYTLRASHGLIEMRQVRFREQLQCGKEHPHDVCAIGRNNDEIRVMISKYGLGSCDFSLTEKEQTNDN